MAVISVPRPLTSIDALIYLAEHPLPTIAPVSPARRMAELPPQERRTAPPPAPADPTQATPLPAPPAASPALFSPEYGARIFAARLRRVLALQAEAEVAATALYDRRSGGRS